MSHRELSGSVPQQYSLILGGSGFAAALFLSVAAFFSPIILLFPPAALASHAGQSFGVEDCSNCHSLDENEGEGGTSYISSASRTLPTIKSLNPPLYDAPDSFGCTYCHNNSLNTVKMKDALSHFGSKTSKHPVGHDRSTGNTQNEFLTAWDTNFTGELDCIDCHDPALLVDPSAANMVLSAPYANHVTPGTGGRVGNPTMLREAVLTDLCRGCHGATPAAWWTNRGKANPPALADHDETALAENDGTPLKTSDCADCHDTHYSSKYKLFNDGHEGDTEILMGDDTECATVCHYRGDSDGNYDSHGHGMATSSGGGTLGFGCGSCHNVNTRHDSSNAKMLNFSEDSNTSIYGKSLRSVCYICHGGYDAHTGGSQEVGCLDCHDEHAEGSGPASNIYMIPTELPNNYENPPGTPMTDTVFFEDSGAVAGAYNYFNDPGVPDTDGTGLCDNAVCHAGVMAPDLVTPVNPLNEFMVTAAHSGGTENPNSNCKGCHTHDDNAGSWGAGASCDNCHGYPPTTLAHNRHVNVYGFSCDACHQNGGAHNESGIADSAEYLSTPIATIRNNVDVSFDTAWKNGANAAGAYSQAKGARTGAGDGTCSGLSCHGDAFAIGAAGTDTTPEWDDSATAACGTCHSAANPGTGTHGDHVNAAAAFGITVGCGDCHTSELDTSTHVNAEPSFAAGLAYGGDVTDNDNSLALGGCGTNSCHNDGKNAAPYSNGGGSYTWGSDQLNDCRICHGDDASTQTSEAHDPHLAYQGTIGSLDCSACHAAAAGNASMAGQASHIDGTVDMANGGGAYNGTVAVGDAGFGSCNTGACHNATTDIAWDATPTNCDQCHLFGSDVNNFDGTDGTASTVSSTEYAVVGHGARGPVCLDCHDISQVSAPHDFTAALSGANPFRLLDQDGGTGGLQFNCTSNAANCHDGVPTASVATVVNHTSAGMSAAGYAPQVNSWGFTPKCVDCHDPHGDGSNIRMIQRDLWEGSSTANEWGVPTSYPPENTALVYTDDTSGVLNTGESYADGDSPWSSLCQECHETSDTDMQSFLDNSNAQTPGTGTASTGPHPTSGGNPGDCAVCHTHDTAFKPSGCSGCHGGTVGADTDGYWPDEPFGTGNPEDDAGRHPAHMAAMASSVYGETIAQLLTNNTAQNPLLSSDQKQVELCSYCHDTPGSDGDHSVTLPAEVNSLSNLWNKVADNAVWNTASGGTCASVNCHNNKTTTTTAPYDYAWYGANTTACLMCHADLADTTAGTTGATHEAHTGQSATYGRVIGCGDCHDGPPAWGTPGTPPDPGHIDGSFALSGTVSPSYTGVFPATPGTCGVNVCHNDGTGSGSANRAYTWETALPDDCASCHLPTPATLGHPAHLSATAGPQAACGDCHDPETATTHLNGAATFGDALALAGTAACTTCHGDASGAATAKTEWPLGAGHWLGTAGGYCEHCHDATAGTVSTAAGTGGSPVTAPNMMGDGTTYGAAVTGHTLSSGFYPESQNAAAVKGCDVCHDDASAHIDGTPGSTLRIRGTLNGVDVSLATEVEEYCLACHQSPGGDQGLQVSTHGNTGAGFQSSSTHDAPDPTGAEDFEYRCDACHEVHGLVLNSGGNPNIYMVKPDIEVRNWRTAADAPAGGPDDTTTISVVFEARSGTDSFDDGATPGDNLCVACHVDNTNRPGYGTLLDNAAGDGSHAGLDNYSNPEAGNDCSSCHGHEYDGDTSSVDGIMPLQCDGCHAYPPATSAHLTHAGTGGGEYAMSCGRCHQNAGLHNETPGITDTTTWTTAWTTNPGTIRNNVDVAFDTFNTGGSYSIAKGARANDTTTYGTCDATYCHSGGTDTVTPYGDAPATALAWNGSSSCWDCHGNGTDSAMPSTLAHPTHMTAVHGPQADCGDCHGPAAPPGHVNKAVTFEDTNEVTWGTLTVDGTVTTCDTCHNGSPATAKSEWELGAGHWLGTTGGYCEHCHDGTPSTVNTVAGTGGADATAPDVLGDEATYGATVTGHNTSGAGAYASGNDGAAKGCLDCHGEGTAHIDGTDGGDLASARPAATVNGQSMAGATVVEEVCQACHHNADGRQVSTHGNTDGGFQSSGVHDPNAENFAYRCEACHEPHGMVLNSNTPQAPNLYMIRADVEVRNYDAAATTDEPVGGPNRTATIPVIFESKTGTDSFDDGTGTDRLCVVCHADGTNRPGLSTPLANSAGDGTHNGLSLYGNSEVGNDCSACHGHDVDGAPATVDGIMPLPCNSCHGGGLAGEGNLNYWPDSQATNGTTWPNRAGGGAVTQTHTKHVTRIAEVVYGASPTTAQKNATCDWCHPTGAHTGDAADHASAPATLHDGTTTTFKNVAGGANVRTSVVTQDPGADLTWDDPAPSDDEVTCSNVDCHYTRAMPATAWHDNPPQSTTCVFCHGDLATYSPGDLPNAHDRHVGDYGKACTECHPVLGGTFNHQNGVVDIQWSGGPPDADRLPAAGPAGPTKFGGGNAGDYTTCSGLYCHGDWDDSGTAPNGGNDYAANWFNTAAEVGGASSDGRCGTCHGDVNGGATDTDKAWPRGGANTESHGEHVGSNASPDCSTCHYDASGTNGTYGNAATHANGAFEGVAIAAAYGYEAGTASFEGTGNTCSGVLCHNGVQTPDFTLSGDANIACGDCHNNGGSDPRPNAGSTSDAGGSGTMRGHSVSSHTDGTQTSCTRCHPGADLYTPVGPGGTNHQNLAVNVSSADFAYGPDGDPSGVNYAAGDGIDDGTCSFTAGCHGTASPVWGGTLTNGCFECHAGSEANAKPTSGGRNDGVPNPVNATQYDAQGHGRTGSAYPGNGNAPAGLAWDGGAGSDCYECHSVGAQHAPTTSGSDPFRLGGSYSDALCDGCHGVGGSATVIDIVAHTKTLTGSSKDWPGTPDYDYKCVDCHDPHGDGNWFMVRSHVSAPTSAGDTSFGSDAEGSPLDAANLSPVTFTSVAGYGAGSYGISGTTNGICEVCHNQTSYYQRGDAAAQTHNTSTQCTTCHKHTGAFKAACDDCHGYPPLDNVAGHPNAGQYADALEDDYTGGGGAHGVNGHVPFGSVKSDGWGPCLKCHSGGSASHVGDTGALNATTWTNVGVDVDPSYDLLTGAAYDGVIGDDSLLPKPPNPYKTCSNVSCHYGLTPDWAMRPQVPPDDVTLQGAADTSGASVINGTTNYDMLSFDLLVTAVNDDGTATLDSVEVTFAGTASSDVSRVSVWDDAGGPGAEIGSTVTWTANVATVTVTGQPITGSPSTFHVRYDIAAGAGNGNTVTAEVTGIGFSTIDTLAAGTPTATGASSTVLVDTLTAVVITDTQGSTTPSTEGTVTVDSSRQYYATASYSISGDVDVTGTAIWSVSPNNSGSPGAPGGFYTAGSTGDVTDTLRADFGGQFDTHDIFASYCSDGDPTTIVTTYPSDGGDLPADTDSYVAADITAGDGALYQYSVNGGAWTDAATPINMPEGGPHTLVTRALDPDCGDTYDSAQTTFNVISGPGPWSVVETFDTGAACEGTFTYWVQDNSDSSGRQWVWQDCGAGAWGSTSAGPEVGSPDPAGSYCAYTELSGSSPTDTTCTGQTVQTRAANDEWILILGSPIDYSVTGDVTFRFYLNHFGADAGTVYIDTSDDNGSTWNPTPQWTSSGEYGSTSTWSSQIVVPLTQITSGSQNLVRIRKNGGSTTSYLGDTAIDRLELDNGGGGGSPPRTLTAMHINDTAAPDTGEISTDTVAVNGSATYYADSEWDQPPSPVNSSATATWNWVQNQSGGTIVNGVYTAGSTPGTDIISATMNAVTSNQVTITVRGMTNLHVNKVGGSDTSDLSAAATGTGGAIDFFAVSEWSAAPLTEDNTAAATWSFVQNQTGAAAFSNGNYVAGGTPGTDIIRATYNGMNSATDVTITVTPRAITALHVNKTGGTDTGEVTADAVSPSGTIQFYAVGEYDQPPTPEDNTATATWNIDSDTTGGATLVAGLYTAGPSDGTTVISATVDAVTSNTVTITVSSVALRNHYENFEGTSGGEDSGTIWLQATDDDRNWCLDAGGTPSSSTGPTVDEDPGNASGWYIYTEGSTAGTPPTGCTNQTAQGGQFHLEYFEAITRATMGPMKLGFWYHRYGTGMGTLEVQYKIDTGAWTTFTGHSYGQTHLAQGDPWLYAEVDVAAAIASGTEFWLRFRSSGDTALQSDGALDSIKVWNDGSGAPAPPSQTGGPTLTACDTCHEFAPNDDILTVVPGSPDASAISAAFGYIPENASEYVYGSLGDHIRHGVGDQGSPANPDSTDATICVPCHGGGVTGYGNDHTDGVKTMASADDNGAAPWDQGSGTELGGGYFNTTDRRCYNVDCHFGATTPVWGTGSTDCDTCHGYPPDGSVSGTTNHLQANRDRNGQGPSATGDAAFFSAHTQCDVCHGVSGNTDWDVAGTNAFGAPVDKTPTGDAYVTSGPGLMHGDGSVQMNGAGGDNYPPDDENTDYLEAAGGCTKGCHTAPAEDWRLVTRRTANVVELREFGAGGGCDACHGGGTSGASAKNYWPDAGARGDADSAGSPDDLGAHLVHVQSLADARWGEDIATLLTDNGNGTADAKQVILCEYCHPSRATDTSGGGDHFNGDNAEVAISNGDYAWTGEFPFIDGTAVGDDGDFNTYASPTCGNVDCHNNVATPSWYSAPQTSNATCTICHSGITTHTSGGGTDGCMDCHPGGPTNPNKHTAAGNPNTIEIPNPSTSFNTMDDSSGTDLDMQDRLGISYAFGGIHLGGENTTGSTEADICWGCHGTDDAVNEWGYNFDTSPGFPTFVIDDINSTTTASHNYGWIYSDAPGGTLTADWTNNDGGGAYREDAYSTVAALSRQIFSIHSANVEASPTGRARISSVGLVPSGGTVTAGTAANLEEKANIRCSYCHDVHDLNLSVKERASGDNKPQSGRPYLRGRWAGNPYPPDFPPLSTYTYPSEGGPTANRSLVGNRYTGGGGTMSEPTPRLFAWSYASDTLTSPQSPKGGYWIDQNSDDPPGSAPYNDTTQADAAGICLLCHEMSVGSMDYYDNGTLELWQDSGTTNGHNNSVQGGGGSGFDLFDGDRFMSGSDVNMGAQDGVNTTDWGSNSNNSWPFLGSGFSNGGNYCQPASNCPPRNSGWYGGTAGAASRDANYSSWYGAASAAADAHKFSCSKCHSPHATGLPALLITNCLDQTNATWSGAGGDAQPSANSANNCHRKTGTTDGWNRLDAGQ